MPSKEETTRTLIELTNGGEDAAAKLVPVVHEKLKAIAARYMKQERLELGTLKLTLQRKVSSRNGPVVFDNFCHGNDLRSLTGARHECRRDSTSWTWT